MLFGSVARLTMDSAKFFLIMLAAAMAGTGILPHTPRWVNLFDVVVVVVCVFTAFWQDRRSR